MTLGSSVLGLNDLPLLEARAVQQRNRDLRQLGRREYALEGMPLLWSMEVEAADDLMFEVWLAFEHAGHPVHMGCSHSLVQAWLSPWGLKLSELNLQSLDFLALSRLVPQLPDTVRFGCAALKAEALGSTEMPMVSHGQWQARHAQTGEALAHRLRLVAPPDFPVYGFFGALDAVLKPRLLPPRLARLSISLPLVAARWDMQSAELAGLEVGDVILLR